MTIRKAPPWTASLETFGACSEAVRWAQAYATPEAAWAACQRADWLIWIWRRLTPPSLDRDRRLVWAATGCARIAIPRWIACYPKNDRPQQAILAGEAWVLDPTPATASAAWSAAKAAWSAASAARSDAESAAADAAASAASAAWSAASAAWSAASVASAESAESAAASAAEIADLVRAILPYPGAGASRP